jgi:murein DD-endopeptidase MepM/ murein hydrolase activator NlpD
MKIIGYIVTIVLILYAVESIAGSLITLRSIERRNPQVKEIRRNVRQTIKTIRGKKDPSFLPQLTFYSYKVKNKDTFWKVISSVGMDIDTLLSVNDLSSPSSIQPGIVILIPNMRGIIISGNEKKKLYQISSTNKIDIKYIKHVNKSPDLNKKYLFIPEGKVTRLERSLFLGTAFLSPLKKGRETSSFGMRDNPTNRGHREFHKGIDLSCPVGTPIYAARSGTVIFSGFRGGYGRLIIIRHEHNYLTYYGHLSRNKVKKGDRIRTGQLIALSGNTGRSTGPHLHFETRKGNRPINPALMTRKR